VTLQPLVGRETRASRLAQRALIGLGSLGMDGADMVEIPAGPFRMGCAYFYPEERPVREVQVNAFAIGRGPVTVGQFARFTEDAPT
jgi:formylglycine-generating enzyme required for sulfatase activity